jgi:hypothetical protein
MMSGAMTGAGLNYGGAPCEITVNLDKIEGRKQATMRDRNRQPYKAPVFMVSLD